MQRCWARCGPPPNISLAALAGFRPKRRAPSRQPANEAEFARELHDLASFFGGVV